MLRCEVHTWQRWRYTFKKLHLVVSSECRTYASNDSLKGSGQGSAQMEPAASKSKVPAVVRIFEAPPLLPNVNASLSLPSKHPRPLHLSPYPMNTFSLTPTDELVPRRLHPQRGRPCGGNLWHHGRDAVTGEHCLTLASRIELPNWQCPSSTCKAYNKTAPLLLPSILVHTSREVWSG